MRNREEMNTGLTLFPLFLIFGINKARDGAFIDTMFSVPPAEISKLD